MNDEEVKKFVLNHSKSPKNGVFPEEFNALGKMSNPLCGDHVEFRLLAKEGTIKDIGYKAEACAICQASSSLVRETLVGENVDAAVRKAELFENTIANSEKSAWPKEIVDFQCFEHLRVMPSRRICAILPWVAIKSALKNMEE